MPLGASEAATRFEIQPVLDDAVPDVARFLARYDDGERRGAGAARTPFETSRIEQRLRWLLLENPLTTPTSAHGLCIRDGAGGVVGLLLAFPSAFRVGDQRLLGIGSGSFFVEPAARTLGFHLFKRHLRWPGYDFFFSTTCNAASGALWRMLGAAVVPSCAVELVLPLDLGVMFPAFLAGRAPSPILARLARLVGRGANPLLRRRAGRTAGPVTTSRDWDKLADLARRHRPPDVVTGERSAAFLEWRYGPRSPNHAADVCVFRDPHGQEGWFVLGETVRGDRVQVRGRALLDAVWPRERMRFSDVLAAIVRFAGERAHALYFRPRPGVDDGECGRWIVRRPVEPPTVVAVAGRGRGPLALSALDLVPADGDSAFRMRG